MVDVTIHDDTIDDDTIDAIDATASTASTASTEIHFKCIQSDKIKKQNPSPSNDQSHF